MNESKRYLLATIVAISKHIIIGLILIIGIIKGCIIKSTDSIDNSVNKSRKIVAHVEVVDSLNNGFRVVYATVNSVTSLRFDEIRKRVHIIEAFNQLKQDGQKYFTNLLHTDIYEFADFAVKYDVDQDIHIHNIFITGRQKMNLYVGYNPKIPGYAKWIDPNTLQGVQYLSHKDIYNKKKYSVRVYRYWKCRSIFSTSIEDERFSHFSESERIY